MDSLLHDPLTRFLAQAVAIIAASRLVGLVMRRIGQPMVIAEIAAGIMLGPSLLGWLAPELSAALFPATSLGLLQIVSQVGLVLFMFLVGLELDPRMLRGRGHTSVLISHTSIIVPFAMGVGVAFWLYPRFAEPGVRFWAFALFMGAAMSITAFPVLARILTERRLLRTRIGAITIACAAVDDVTAWCILAFVVAITRATGMEAAITTTGLAVGYVLVMLFLLRPLLVRVAARIATPDAMTQNVVAVVIILVFLSAWGTELIGIHALFGAFMFGAILPKEGGFAHALAEKLEDVVLVVMLPLFFAFSGLRTDIALLSSGYHWAVCAVVIAIACAGKFGGAAIPARLTGLSWRESATVGVLMNTRGLMELIVLNIGFDLGVISPTVFSMMVLMALFTTFISTPLVAKIYPTEIMARDLIDEPAPAAGKVEMGVLVCVADDRAGPGLVGLAGALVGKDGGQIHALHLTGPSDRGSDRMEDSIPPSQGPLGPLLERAAQLALPVKPLSYVSTDPGEDICRVAEVRGVDLILLGLHKPVLSQARLGGVVHDVLRSARPAVGVLVNRGLGTIERVLVPFQGTSHDRAALGLARRFLTAGAEVTVLHVVEPGRKGAGDLGASETVESVFEEDGGRVRMEVVEHDDPAVAVLDRSKAGYDLVIVGLGRGWGLEERRFGIQPERLLRDSSGSLLVVREARGGRRAGGLPSARVES